MIAWNNGLSVGVDVLDNDHKKLLEIINKLSATVENNATKDVIEDIFHDLEQYSMIHFNREEAFLKQCGCEKLDEHADQHRMFSDKIPELKTKILSSQNSAIIEEVSVFLTDWLLTHIIDEDIPVITLFKDCGITQEEKEDNSLLARLIKKTTDRFSFTKRIFLSTIIPLSGMLLFGTIIIFANFDKYLDMKKTSTITNITPNINELIHNLQIERGLSSGYLTSTENKFKDSLQEQRKTVDNATKKFTDKIKTIHINNMTIIEPHIKALKTDILSLHNLRKQINDKTISQTKTIDTYSKIIENVLSITPKIASLNLDREISSSIATLSSIQHLKESLGLERAYGTIIIERKDATLKEYVAFTQLLSTQIIFLNTFEQTASKAQKSAYTSLQNSSIAKQIHTYENMVLERNVDNLGSEDWFKSTTKFINKIKLFEDELLDDINKLVDSRIDETILNFILWIIFNTIVLVITLFILYTFKKSTVLQIDQLTSAMKDLATGGRAFRLSPIKMNRDELAYMYDAYETTRQKLLKGDIYTQLYLNKKELELKSKERENIKLEEMAFYDSLTGMINRRKFEELSTVEIKRSIRYKSDLSFLMLDIDHFKAVNDTYGHAAGDEVLKHFSSICFELVRGIDTIARMGGEEFVIMLPQTDEKGAFKFAERLRQRVFDSTVTTDNKTIKYSTSIGISILNIDTDIEVDTVLQRADEALYKAKNTGRNKSVIYQN